MENPSLTSTGYRINSQFDNCCQMDEAFICIYICSLLFVLRTVSTRMSIQIIQLWDGTYAFLTVFPEGSEAKL